MAKPTVRARPSRGQTYAQQTDLNAVVGHVNDLLARINVIERALSSVIESVEEIEDALFDAEGEFADTDDDSDDDAGVDQFVELGDFDEEKDPTAPTPEEIQADIEYEAKQREQPAPPSGRTSTAALRRAERAAHAMDEDGPRPGIMTDDMPTPAIPDFKAPGEGVQLQAPEYPRGEPGWADDE